MCSRGSAALPSTGNISIAIEQIQVLYRFYQEWINTAPENDEEVDKLHLKMIEERELRNAQGLSFFFFMLFACLQGYKNHFICCSFICR